MSLLQIKDLEVKFAASGTGVFGLNKQWVRAVNGVSLNRRRFASRRGAQATSFRNWVARQGWIRS